jgi:hypothetical protein
MTERLAAGLREPALHVFTISQACDIEIVSYATIRLESVLLVKTAAARVDFKNPELDCLPP